tara:strand:- start:351 stop:704 length:354 start_codon:yes stop_codon:yes gene_type:complete
MGSPKRQTIVGNGNIQVAGDVAIFTDEWVEENAWMGEANEKAVKEAEPNMMSMFINFPDGVPVPKLRKEWDKYEDWKKAQDENLAIFHNMMKEKRIRAGTGSVGQKHKGWGNGKQRS